MPVELKYLGHGAPTEGFGEFFRHAFSDPRWLVRYRDFLKSQGRPVPTGQSGRLLVRGAQMFKGYYKRPELQTFDSEGWFDSGDLAYRDDDGYIRISGRVKDILIRGGENVPVVEIENLLYSPFADQDLPIVQRPYSNALTALGRQRVRPVERPRSQFVGVQVTGTDMEQGGTQLILARVVVLLHETDRLQRPQDSVHRALRKAQLSRHLDNPEAARPA